MRILAIAPWLPHRQIAHAGGQYVYRHLADLSATEEVSLIAPTSGSVLDGARVDLPRVEVLPVAVDAPTGPIGRGARYLWWLAAGLGPGPQELVALERFLGSTTGRAVAARADLIELHYEEMLPLIDSLPDQAPVVLWVPDVVSEELRTQVARAASRRRRIEARIRLHGAARVEHRYLPQCRGAVVFKPADSEGLAAVGLAGPTRVAAPAVLVDPRSRHRQVNASGPPTALVVAAFDRAVNREGLRWLVEEVWPDVRRQVPSAVLRVVGAQAPAISAAGVDVRGFQAELGPEYLTADVAVVPTHDGVGLKFTVAQALANGLPVVATASAARGYDAPAGAAFLRRGDRPDDLAAALVALLADRPGALEAGALGAAWWDEQAALRADESALQAWYSELVAE